MSVISACVRSRQLQNPHQLPSTDAAFLLPDSAGRFPSLFPSQVLYDAFFKHQRKPKMTALGELYYEGKEYEARLEHLRPGVLSAELREALGMSDATSPPPWLVNMQVRSACWCSCNSLLVMVLMHLSSDVEPSHEPGRCRSTCSDSSFTHEIVLLSTGCAVLDFCFGSFSVVSVNLLLAAFPCLVNMQVRLRFEVSTPTLTLDPAGTLLVMVVMHSCVDVDCVDVLRLLVYASGVSLLDSCCGALLLSVTMLPAALRAAAVVPQPEDPWAQRTHPSWRLVRLPRRRLGQAPCGCARQPHLWRCVRPGTGGWLSVRLLCWLFCGQVGQARCGCTWQPHLRRCVRPGTGGVAICAYTVLAVLRASGASPLWMHMATPSTDMCSAWHRWGGYLCVYSVTLCYGQLNLNLWLHTATPSVNTYVFGLAQVG
jgi:hypothetical protein